MVALRALRDDDDEFLFRVYSSTREQELAPVGWEPAQLEAFLRMQHRAQHSHYWRHYDTRGFSVVTCDGADAGRLYLHRGASALSIVDIALLPEYRGRGIGGMLLSRVAAEADEAGLPITIHVERENPARHLYLRHGFVFRDDATEHPVYRLMERPPRGREAGQAA